MQVATIRVAIVIPVFNDVKRLAKCLEAIAQQTYPRHLIRVYVADNGSTEDIESLTKQFDFVQYLLEPTPGSYNARNKALACLAEEEIVGFTDSDCIAAPNWIESAVHYLETSPNTPVGGAVKIFAESGTNNLVFKYETLFAFPQKEYVEHDHFAVTANLFVTRDMLKTVGNFETSLFSGGDADFGNRLYKHGFPIDYSADVVVQHPARRSIKQIVTKIKRTVGGGYTQRKRNPAAGRLFTWPGLIKSFVPPMSALRKIMSSRRFALGSKLKLCLLTLYLRYYVGVLRLLFKLKLYSSYERL